MINNRIKEIRTRLGLSQNEFGKKLGVGRDAIANIENNRVAPKPLLIDHLCEIFKVNREWLETGAGETFLKSEENEVDPDVLALIDEVLSGENETVRDVFKEFAKLDESDWKMLQAIIERLTKK